MWYPKQIAPWYCEIIHTLVYHNTSYLWQEGSRLQYTFIESIIQNWRDTTFRFDFIDWDRMQVSHLYTCVKGGWLTDSTGVWDTNIITYSSRWYFLGFGFLFLFLEGKKLICFDGVTVERERERESRTFKVSSHLYWVTTDAEVSPLKLCLFHMLGTNHLIFVNFLIKHTDWINVDLF